MPIESGHMAELFKNLGHKVIVSKSATWYDVQPGVLLSLPYCRLIEPSQEELDTLIKQHKLRAIRYPSALNGFGFFSTLAVNTNTDYDLSHQHQKSRNQTRRGLENNKVEQIDFDYLIEHGLSLNEDTAIRQGRESQYADAAYWKKYCLAAKASAGVSAWGAFAEGKLAAFLVAIECGDWAEWVVNHSSTALRDKYPNNALAFVAAQYFFREKKCKGLCYGLGSLEETEHLDHFKVRMGWQLQPIKQRLVFSQKLRCLFSLANEPSLRIIGRLFPKSYAVRKTAAMIRLYRKQSFDIPNAINEQTPEQGQSQ